MQRSLRGKKRRNSIDKPPNMSEVNMMLLGSVGSGKSASGNTIIGGDTFREDCSPEAVTRSCESAQTEVDGQKITMIDTVGLYDTDMKITDAQTKIEQMLPSTDLDVFLLVIKLGQTFTQEEKEVVKRIQENFGTKALKHTIVLFTHGDMIQEPIEDHLSKHEALQSVVDQCSGGFHVFNNRDEDRAQVTELLEKINRLRVTNKYSRYTEKDYRGDQKSTRMKTCAIVAGAVTGAATAVVGTGGLGASGGASAVTGLAAAGGSILHTVGTIVGAAAGGAALGAAAVGVGLYLMTRKYISKQKND